MQSFGFVAVIVAVSCALSLAAEIATTTVPPMESTAPTTNNQPIPVKENSTEAKTEMNDAPSAGAQPPQEAIPQPTRPPATKPVTQPELAHQNNPVIAISTEAGVPSPQNANSTNASTNVKGKGSGASRVCTISNGLALVSSFVLVGLVLS